MDSPANQASFKIFCILKEPQSFGLFEIYACRRMERTAKHEKEEKLNSRQRSYLNALANKLEPVVAVGKGGPTESVLAALDAALEAHELVKLRFVVFKDEKKEIAREFAKASGAELVRLIGNVAILFRPNQDPEKRKISLP
jgi:RNA-binding protein